MRTELAERLGDTFAFAAATGGRNTIAPGRCAVAVQMFVVVAIILDLDRSVADDLDRQRDKLIARLAAPGAHCGFMSVDGGLEHFRRLAWDAAESLVEERNSDRLLKWAAILREVLRALPECASLID